MPRYDMTITVPIQVDAPNALHAVLLAREHCKLISPSSGWLQRNRDIIRFRMIKGKMSVSKPLKRSTR